MRELRLHPDGRRRTLLLFALSAVLAIALGFAIQRYVGTRFVAAYDLSPRSPDEVAAVGEPRGFEAINVEQQAALIRRPVSGHTWLLYWGGNTSQYFHEAVATIEGLQLPSDIGVLIVAPRGYDSEGHPSPDALEQAATNTRQWLRREEQARRIVTGGFSMGIYSALVAAEKDVAGTFVMGAAPVFQANDPGPFVRLKVPDSYRLRPTPPQVPAIVIQGGLDEVEHGRAVANWLGARFVVVPGVSHVETQRNAQALRAARDFIEDALQ